MTCCAWVSADMRCAIIIPARFGSSRFAGKPLASIRGAGGEARSLIARTIEAGRAAAATHDLLVATDDQRIADSAEAAGARAVLTPSDCRNGTERCASVVNAGATDAEIIVNLQGDAPLTPPTAIAALIKLLQDCPDVAVASPMIRCCAQTAARLVRDEAQERVGGTTVVTNQRRDALYFSKKVIPYGGDTPECPINLHLGVYAYRAEALRRYATAAPSPLELAEGLEQLRFLDLGIPIRMVEIEEPAGGLWEVNNPEDIVIVERALSVRGIV